jgi:DedD protein
MSGPVSSPEAQAEINSTEATGPDAPAPAEPVQLSRLSVPDVPADPVQSPSRKSAREPAPGEQTAAGDGWSINIASYTREATAEKMRSRFLDKGVETNIATALVNGKTYYRLRVTGLANRAEATVKSTEIKEKLGLKETWITRQ